MEITFLEFSDTLQINLIGELDESESRNAKETIDSLIESTNKKAIVFDLCRLAFMDSTGIGVMIGRYKFAKKRGISLFVKNPSATINKIFVMSGLYEIMPKVG